MYKWSVWYCCSDLVVHWTLYRLDMVVYLGRFVSCMLCCAMFSLKKNSVFHHHLLHRISHVLTGPLRRNGKTQKINVMNNNTGSVVLKEVSNSNCGAFNASSVWKWIFLNSNYKTVPMSKRMGHRGYRTCSQQITSVVGWSQVLIIGGPTNSFHRLYFCFWEHRHLNSEFSWSNTS